MMIVLVRTPTQETTMTTLTSPILPPAAAWAKYNALVAAGAKPLDLNAAAAELKLALVLGN
jgi:hypothetical protein